MLIKSYVLLLCALCVSGRRSRTRTLGAGGPATGKRVAQSPNVSAVHAADSGTNISIIYIYIYINMIYFYIQGELVLCFLKSVSGCNLCTSYCSLKKSLLTVFDLGEVVFLF